jgi:hypothetical protein
VHLPTQPCKGTFCLVTQNSSKNSASDECVEFLTKRR